VQTVIRIYAHFTGLAQTSARLPAGWSVLSVLTHLDPAKVERLRAEGKIHPKLTLNEAKILAGKSTPKEAPRLGAGEWAQKVANQAAEHLSEWPDTERQMAARELVALAEKLSSMCKKPASAKGAVVGTAKAPAPKESVKTTVPVKPLPQPSR
jgi:hypothetical protein